MLFESCSKPFFILLHMMPDSTDAAITGSANEVQPYSGSTRDTELAVNGLQSRSVFLPEREEARRKGTAGKVGSQRAMRFQFNNAVCKAAGIPKSKVYPISPSKSRQICSRVRGILHKTHSVKRGAHTYTELKDICDMQQARRILEKCFPLLTVAENQ